MKDNLEDFKDCLPNHEMFLNLYEKFALLNQTFIGDTANVQAMLTVFLHKNPSQYGYYGKCSNISNTFLLLFSNKMLAIKAGIHKMLVRI